LNLSPRADPPNRRIKPNRHEAEQFEFIFRYGGNAGPIFTQMEFPWLLRPSTRTKRKNFSEFEKALRATARAKLIP
jgi:hypothetical protein